MNVHSILSQKSLVSAELDLKQFATLRQCFNSADRDLEQFKVFDCVLKDLTKSFCMKHVGVN